MPAESDNNNKQIMHLESYPKVTNHEKQKILLRFGKMIFYGFPMTPLDLYALAKHAMGREVPSESRWFVDARFRIEEQIGHRREAGMGMRRKGRRVVRSSRHDQPQRRSRSVPPRATQAIGTEVAAAVGTL
jgi:hypothetical protein